MFPGMPVGAFLACTLLLFPLPRHWRTRNIPTLSMIAWLFISNFTYGINVIIWSGRTHNVAPVWCDIVTKTHIGATAAGPATCLSLVLQLWRVATSRPNNTKTFVLDLFLCWGYPGTTMALHLIVQGHRFNIWENFGCYHTTYVSIPAILLLYGPITLIGVLNFIFGGLAFYNFWQHRHSFAEGLEREKSPFNMRRYVRAMIVTILIAIWDAAVIVVVDIMVSETKEGFRPYTSWADVHSDFWHVYQYPITFMPPKQQVLFTVMWWTVPCSAYWFFCCFALSDEGAAECVLWYRRILWLFGRRDSGVSDLVELQPSSTPPQPDISDIIDVKYLDVPPIMPYLIV
ncbi:Fungal pheromone STE3G-protein-coupled receptor [Mycena sanguinolenta]|uniref:Fungal pheromone STE3G-protein-coupled receptor n=1 Tax=Mycena sanguinolenta TaxID=230812 RepID=A0A8H6Z036_9AGAR|nr:Fungal pheromone STE3G-protein-coupled receptor [Mycena sanguinolenta]